MTYAELKQDIDTDKVSGAIVKLRTGREKFIFYTLSRSALKKIINAGVKEGAIELSSRSIWGNEVDNSQKETYYVLLNY